MGMTTWLRRRLRKARGSSGRGSSSRSGSSRSGSSRSASGGAYAIVAGAAPAGAAAPSASPSTGSEPGARGSGSSRSSSSRSGGRSRKRRRKRGDAGFSRTLKRLKSSKKAFAIATVLLLALLWAAHFFWPHSQTQHEKSLRYRMELPCKLDPSAC